MNKLYHCPNCKSILYIQESRYFSKIVRPTRQNNMIRLKDDFDLAEIVTEDNNVIKNKENSRKRRSK